VTERLAVDLLGVHRGPVCFQPRGFRLFPLSLPQERFERFGKVTVAVGDAHTQFDVVGPLLQTGHPVITTAENLKHAFIGAPSH